VPTIAGIKKKKKGISVFRGYPSCPEGRGGVKDSVLEDVHYKKRQRKRKREKKKGLEVHRRKSCNQIDLLGGRRSMFQNEGGGGAEKKN